MPIDNLGRTGSIGFTPSESPEAAGEAGTVDQGATVARGSAPVTAGLIQSGGVAASDLPGLSSVSTTGTFGVLGSEGVELLEIAGEDGASVSITETGIWESLHGEDSHPFPGIALTFKDADGVEQGFHFGEGLNAPYLSEHGEAGIPLHKAAVARQALDGIRSHLAATAQGSAPLDGQVGIDDVARTDAAVKPLLQKVDTILADHEQVIAASPEAKLGADLYTDLHANGFQRSESELEKMIGDLEACQTSVQDRAGLTPDQVDAVAADLADLSGLLKVYLEDARSGGGS